MSLWRYRALFVEDDVSLQQFYRLNFGKNHELLCEYTSSVEETITLLKSHSFDVIILDYNLPDGTAFDIIPLVSGTPVIFVTGVVDVGLSVKAIKAGAYDYLLKDSGSEFIQILPLIIEKAINHHKAQEAFKESEERYRDLFENSSDLIQSVSADGYFLYVNPTWLKTLRYNESELSHLFFLDIVHPSYHTTYEHVFSAVKTGERIDPFELKLLTKDGEEIIVEANISCKVVNGRPIATRGVFRNITARKVAETRLVESEEKYRLLVESASDVIYQINTNGYFTFVNELAPKIIGYTREETLKMHFTDLVADGFKDQVKDFYTSKLKQASGSSYFEFPVKRKDGKVIWIGQNVKAMTDEMNPKWVKGFFAIARDISERREMELVLKQMNEELEARVRERTHELLTSNKQLRDEIKLRMEVEEALKESEMDYRGLFENAHDPIIVFDPEHGKVVDVNEQACMAYQFTRKEFIGLSVETIARSPKKVRKHIKITIEKGAQHNFETIHFRKDGTEMQMDISGSIVYYKGKKVILSINRDVTKRKEMERTLNVERRRRLSAIIDGQEMERRRLARELHDGLGQLLTAVKLHINKIFNSKNLDNKQLDNLKETKTIIQDTIIEVKKISHDLMPNVLNDFGLWSALNKLVDQVVDTSDLSVNLDSDGIGEQRLGREIEIGIYRIVQEALNNVVKYAEASEVSILLSKREEDIELEISDNGKGFDTDRILNHASQHLGNGIFNMRERAELLNGTFKIKSSPRNGTVVRIRIPMGYFFYGKN
ncbi:MAG: PAS domain S-box protein [Bacteroidota bacterium]